MSEQPVVYAVPTHLTTREPFVFGRSLDEFAKIAGMGRRTFTRTFRDETGMAFAMWRQQIRLMAAISMLSEGQSITNIAYEVGYESPSSFTAMFHRVLGVAPSHYARSNVRA